MSTADLIAAVDVSASLALFGQMIRQQSYSEMAGERALSVFMRETMRRMGLEADLRLVPGERCNTVGRWRGQGGRKSLLYNGHLDTNSVTLGWTVEPFAGHIDDRFIYGIGVSNMKAGDAAYLSAVKTLERFRMVWNRASGAGGGCDSLMFAVKGI
jgi:acetylornithine deacetylase